MIRRAWGAALLVSLLSVGVIGCDEGKSNDKDTKTEKSKSSDKDKADDKDKNSAKSEKTVETKFKKGDAVDADSHGTWYKAEILEVTDDGKYKIHYTGWSDSWDTEVDESKLREPKEITYSYKEGDIVEVEWKEKWYKSKILSVEGEDKFKVHYEGWGDEWDEVVVGNRIRELKG